MVILPIVSILKVSSTAALCILVASCASSPSSPSIKSDAPDRAIPAIKSETAAGNKKAIPYLVHDLESTDAAERMYAIDGLRRLTGQDFGYVYYEETDQRQPAVDQWKHWLAEHPSP